MTWLPLVVIGVLGVLALLAIGQDFYHRRTCPLCRFYNQKSSEEGKKL